MLRTSPNPTLDLAKPFPKLCDPRSKAQAAHTPDKVLKGAEGDHAAHALARRREGVVQQHVADAGHVHHPIVVEVGREGHSKRQGNKRTVSRDRGKGGDSTGSSLGTCSEHLERGCAIHGGFLSLLQRPCRASGVVSTTGTLKS